MGERAIKREKRTYCVLTFSTTTAAMAMECFCQEHGVPGRLIPIPTAITAGCGLAWRMLPEEFSALKPKLGGVSGRKLDLGELKIECEDIVTLEL
jgi:hypothetical protein